jgi:hypothetical protein
LETHGAAFWDFVNMEQQRTYDTKKITRLLFSDVSDHAMDRAADWTGPRWSTPVRLLGGLGCKLADCGADLRMWFLFEEDLGMKMATKV